MTKNKKVVKKEKKVNKNTKERVVPFKNYLILLFLCLATIGIVAFASIAYRRAESKKLETPVISGVISELKKEDLDNYVVENDSFFLYIGAAADYNSREVETALIKYFDKRDIKNNTIFLNVSNENDLSSFYKDFNKKYVVNDYSKIENFPAFVIFKDGKVLDLVQRKDTQKLNIGDIDRVLDEYGY